MFRKKIKSVGIVYIPYIIIFVFSFTFNLMVYKYLQALKFTNQILVLENYYCILRGMLCKSFLEEIQQNSQNLNNIQFELDQIIPSSIDYQVKINNIPIALSQNYDQSYILTREFSCKGNNIIVKLNYNILNTENRKFNKDISFLFFLCIGMSLIFILVNICIYYLKTKAIKLKNIELKEINIINKNLRLNKEAEKKIKFMFINKATEIYINQTMGPIKPHNKLEQINYLFPLTLIDRKKDEIIISELIELLNNYYGYLSSAISLKYEPITDKLNVTCSKEVFYQLVFSLINNLVILMMEQNDKTKILLIYISNDLLKFKYNSYPINEKTIIKISNQLQDEYLDPFFLSCEKIFNSLKSHDFNYKLSYETGTNVIEIFLNNKKNTINKIKPIAKILKFTINNGK